MFGWVKTYVDWYNLDKDKGLTLQLGIDFVLTYTMGKTGQLSLCK